MNSLTFQVSAGFKPSNEAAFRDLVRDYARQVTAIALAGAKESLAQPLAQRAVELALMPTRYWTHRPSIYPNVQVISLGSPGSQAAHYTIRLVVSQDAAGRYYEYASRGTSKRTIRARRADALMIRYYVPRTRPVVGLEPLATERIRGWQFTTQRRETVSVSPLEALRGYKGRYTPRHRVRTGIAVVTGVERKPRYRLPQRGKHFFFVSVVRNHRIRPRLFGELVKQQLRREFRDYVNQYIRDLRVIVHKPG